MKFLTYPLYRKNMNLKRHFLPLMKLSLLFLKQARILEPYKPVYLT